MRHFILLSFALVFFPASLISFRVQNQLFRSFSKNYLCSLQLYAKEKSDVYYSEQIDLSIEDDDLKEDGYHQNMIQPLSKNE
jgi:hypothetical protein